MGVYHDSQTGESLEWPELVRPQTMGANPLSIRKGRDGDGCAAGDHPS